MRIRGAIWKSIGVPTGECVSITNHFTISTRSLCHFISQYKLRCIISTSFTVFVENQPVSSRKIGCENHIIGNDYRRVIRVQAFRNMSYDSPFIATLDIPAQQSMLVIQSKVLQNGVIHLCDIRLFQIIFGTQHRAHSVKVGDRKRFIQQRIIIDRIAIRHACIQQTFHICAHTGNSLGV